jgi:hypothetical protein
MTPTNVRRAALLSSFAGVLALAGCSAGADIYVEPTTTERTPSTVCALGPDVCDRTFDLGVSATDQARFVGFLELVVAYADVARAAREEVTSACTSIADGLGAPRPAPGPDARANVRATCAAAADALRGAPERPFDLVVAPATCTPVPPPACATALAPRAHCVPGAVTVAMHDGASAEAARLGQTLLVNVGLLHDVRTRLDLAAQLAASLSSAAGDAAAGGSGAVATSCGSEATAEAAEATADLRLAAELAALVLPLAAPR